VGQQTTKRVGLRPHNIRAKAPAPNSPRVKSTPTRKTQWRQPKHAAPELQP
jgi:hypothetical protein